MREGKQGRFVVDDVSKYPVRSRGIPSASLRDPCCFCVCRGETIWVGSVSTRFRL